MGQRSSTHLYFIPKRVCILPGKLKEVNLTSVSFGNVEVANPSNVAVQYKLPTYDHSVQNDLRLYHPGQFFNLYCNVMSVMCSPNISIDTTDAICNTSMYMWTLSKNCTSGLMQYLIGRPYEPLPFLLRLHPYVDNITELNPHYNSTITGAFFTTSTPDPTFNITVVVGDTEIVPTSISNNQITFIPPVSVGSTTIVVKNSNLYGNSSIIQAKYAAPKVDNIVFNGTAIIFNGDLFGDSTELVTISNITKIPLVPTYVSYNKMVVNIDSINNRTLRSGYPIITVAGTAAISATLFNILPIISLVTSPPVIGGYITILGEYLNTQSYSGQPILAVGFDSVDRHGLEDVDGGVRFLAPPGTGPNHNITINGVTAKVSYQSPFIESVSSTYPNQPSKVTIIGNNFGTTGLNVTIGGSICIEPILVDPNTISCIFASDVTPANESHTVTVAVDGLEYSSISFIYHDFECPNQCNHKLNQGDCLDGDCVCHDDWNGSPDCGKATVPSGKNVTISDNSTDAFVGSNDGTSFGLGITHLREINANGDSVKTISIPDSIFVSIPLLTLSVNVTVFRENSTYNFGGDYFPIMANSVKYQVEVANWQFDRQINRLQVIFLTETDAITSSCVQGVMVASENRILQLTKEGVELRGRFSDRVIFEGRVAHSVVTQLGNDDDIVLNYTLAKGEHMTRVFTAVTSPSFRTKTTLDPTFGALLVGEEHSDSCNSSTPSWKIPVIVVGSVLGAALVGVIIFFACKRYSTKIKVMAHNTSTKLKILTRRG
eukprot:gene4117-4807_t